MLRFSLTKCGTMSNHKNIYDILKYNARDAIVDVKLYSIEDRDYTRHFLTFPASTIPNFLALFALAHTFIGHPAAARSASAATSSESVAAPES